MFIFPQCLILHHIDGGEVQFYPVDAIDAMASWPLEWKIEPWSADERADAKAKMKAQPPVADQRRRYRVKHGISIGGHVYNAGEVLETHIGKPHAQLEPLNDAAREWTKNYLRAEAQIRDRLDGDHAEKIKMPEVPPHSIGLERVYFPSMP
jgi:hypothetical protein